jgi:hypothetical protein
MSYVGCRDLFAPVSRLAAAKLTAKTVDSFFARSAGIALPRLDLGFSDWPFLVYSGCSLHSPTSLVSKSLPPIPIVLLKLDANLTRFNDLEIR